MQVTLITPENRQIFHKELEQIFRLRHEVFNGWLGWGLPNVDGQEFDKYDNHAVHICATDGQGRVVGTWRMMPTTRPFMTEEVFPELLEGLGTVKDPQVWDLSRFAVDRAWIAGDKKLQERLLAALASSVYEFGLMNGVAEFLSVQSSYITPIANRMLGDPVWSGATIQAGKSDATCYSYTPTMERLYALRAQYELAAPVLLQYQVTGLQAAA